MAKTIRELIIELLDASTEAKLGLDAPVRGFHDSGELTVVVSEDDGRAYVEESEEST